MTASLYINTNDVPRSNEYKNKEIKNQCYVDIKGTRYFKRVFFDDSVELVRFDYTLNKWVFLLFI